MSIGENMQIRRFDRFEGNFSVPYAHAGGALGVLVNLAVEGDIDATEIGKNVAMQIAAMNAKYWDKSLVPQADVAHELQVQVAAMASGVIAGRQGEDAVVAEEAVEAVEAAAEEIAE